MSVSGSTGPGCVILPGMSAAESSTLPAPPKLPSDLGPYDAPTAAPSDTPTSLESLKDSAAAKWDQVRAAVSACTETSTATLDAIQALDRKFDQRFEELNKSRAAESKMLVARFDDLDREVKKARDGVTRSNTLIANLNQLLTGVRSHANSLQQVSDETRDRVSAVEMALPDRDPPGLRVVSREG